MNCSAQRQYHPYHGILPVAVVVPSLYQTSCAFKEVNPDTSEEKGAGLTVNPYPATLSVLGTRRYHELLRFTGLHTIIYIS